jgi:mannose-1-phosphate guanylyltransferase/mannose-6-phosphate isomerase
VLEQLIKPVILAGGSGTRLWPLSTPERPKAFLKLGSDRSLFQSTVLRCQDRSKFLSTLIIGNRSHQALIRQDLSDIGILDYELLLEPLARNTAAAVLLACLYCQANTPDNPMLVLPSDHAMETDSLWDEALAEGRILAMEDYLVLFGIAPNHAAAGYGYIEPDLPIKKGYCVSCFHEKPDAETAQAYIDQGMLWNAGIFLFKPHAMLEDAERLCPDIVLAVKKAFRTYTIEGRIYKDIPALPIDKAVFERTDRAAVLPYHGSWSDLGTWQSLYTYLPKDSAGNVVQGPSRVENCRQCQIISENVRLHVIDQQDMLIIATPYASLCEKLI